VIGSWTFGPDEGVPPGVAPFAHATSAGETLYVTGQMPTGLDGRLLEGSVAEQTDQVLRNLQQVLSNVGGSFGDVVQVRAYLLDWADYAAFNAAYEKWFPERLPSRTCIGVSGLAVGALVEIDLVAWRPEGWPAGPGDGRTEPD
jgi:2-iminobutanoate/2-iminopropanoate deaminase